MHKTQLRIGRSKLWFITDRSAAEVRGPTGFHSLAELMGRTLSHQGHETHGYIGQHQARTCPGIGHLIVNQRKTTDHNNVIWYSSNL
jgi:hypothetical protein